MFKNISTGRDEKDRNKTKSEQTASSCMHRSSSLIALSPTFLKRTLERDELRASSPCGSAWLIDPRRADSILIAPGKLSRDHVSSGQVAVPIRD